MIGDWVSRAIAVHSVEFARSPYRYASLGVRIGSWESCSSLVSGIAIDFCPAIVWQQTVTTKLTRPTLATAQFHPGKTTVFGRGCGLFRQILPISTVCPPRNLFIS